MKLKQEKIVYPVQSSFKVLKYSVAYFNMSFHYHPEYELVYITKGSGLRYIGSSIQKFQTGDMVFLGPDLSHIWINPKSYEKLSGLKAEAIVVQFPSDLFSSLIAAPEFGSIKNLLNNSQFGLSITGCTRKTVVDILGQLLVSEGVNKMMLLIKMLDVLSRDKKITFLNTPDYSAQQSQTDKRINAVYSYVMSFYHRKIGSRDAAQIANMEQSAFCRFFKEKTQKTFVQFLTETRIDHACRLLLEKKLSITQIAYETGFNNMAHFYKQFKKITGLTPKEYCKE